MLQNLNVKNHICCEADNCGDSSILPLEESKSLPSANFDLNKISAYYSLPKTESNAAIQENEQHDSVDEEIKV